ncbi:alkaline phosphatase PafA [Flavobacterium sp. JP2137]|uniref:alkaline phosphatase PafA n=1 Tax=Flavobacterium sp. JP2137 TaxID=3414510 RepID=UPI003D2FC5EC
MNFKSRFLVTISLFFSIALFAKDPLPKPKLVVGVVVDQMRWDYLYRFYDRYADNGFKRLLNEGFSCENTYINYVPTYTAIGHSSIYTGSVPAIHGIAGNDFIIQSTGENRYCTQDDSVTGVGVTGKVGMQSPKNLLTSTITDQLKLATNFKSKVIGIAMKDRGGILPAGHFADAAYWFDGESGTWVSSSFYMKQLPKWVSDFNKSKLTEKYLNQSWNTLYPIETYTLSTEDNTVYEGKFKGEAQPVFPRDLKKLSKDNGLDLIKGTPFGNTLTLDLAKAAITAEQLGNNPVGVTDFLAVSLSSTDYIGHQFGIDAIEIEDTYLRLDADLASLITYLDQKIGKDAYTLFLSADHGAAHNPRYFKDKKGNAGYFDTKKYKSEINAMLETQFGKKDLVNSLMNYQVHLNNALVASERLDEGAIRKAIVAYMKKIEGIAFVTDMEETATASIPARIKERIINGYHLKRSGVIQYILEPQWFSGAENGTGTTHGTWSSYDAHIPLVFMGWGVNKGKSNREIHMVDIAPTLAAILKIEEPNGNIGTPIQEAIK